MNLRRTATALLVSVLTLSLVAATDPVPPRGTAATSLTALDLDVSGVPGLTLVDLGSFASTDTDAARNVLGSGSPFAWVGLSPLKVGETVLGSAEASSDGQNNVTGELVSYEEEGLASAIVNPVGLTATATAEQALGAAEAATAQVQALGAALGLSVNATGVASSVTQTASSATQGLHVEGLEVDLGDLVPLDVLELLPIDVLIELLDQLPLGVPDLEAIADAATDAVDDVRAAADALTDAGEQLTADLVALADANTVLADAQAVLTAAQNAETTAQNTLNAAVAARDEIQSDLDSLDLVTLAALLTKYAAECPAAVDVASLTTCLEGVLADAQAAVDDAQAALDTAQAAVTAAAADVQTAQDAVDALHTAIDAAIDALQQLLTDVTDALTNVVTELTTLNDSLGDVVAALADGDILSVGAIEVGVVAHATDTLAGSSATVGCNSVPVEVLGLEVATPDCSNPLTTVSSLAETITTSIQDLLLALPVAQDVIPEASIQVFPTVEESVVQDGDYVTARAHVVPLDVSLGSVTVDPANLVDGLLDTLGAQVDALVAAAIPEDGDVTGLGLPGEADLLNQLDAVRSSLPTVADLQTQLNAVLALLPDGTGLPTVATPSIDLTVDPTSTASFAPGAPGTDDPTAPAPGDTPELPATGGGLALLGLLSLGGAISLRRRR